MTTWTPADPSKTYWTGADDQDPPYYGPGGENPELYNLDSVAYESVMVGMFSWFYPGLGYKDYQLPGPTLVELGVGFSRDGFSWYRPTRGAGRQRIYSSYKPAAHGTPSTPNRWAAASLWSATNSGSIFRTHAAEATRWRLLTGLAKLRRDGFYSMDAGITEGTLRNSRP